MKTRKKFAVGMALALLCMMVLGACGGKKWPTSYTFNGQLKSGTGSADIVLELKEDNTVSMEGVILDEVAGKWFGEWKQNDDGTVAVTFKSAESEPLDPEPPYLMSLNDAEADLGGMGGLEVTSTISDDSINTIVVIIDVAIGEGYTMAFEGELTQEAADK